MSDWGAFSLLVAGTAGAGLVSRQIWIDLRRGLPRPRAWMGWIAGLVVGLGLAAIVFLNAEA